MLYLIEHDTRQKVRIRMETNKTTRLDVMISDMAYILDCLMLLRNIEDTGDCNNCEKAKQCKHLPNVGEMVRYNCPFYKDIQ